MNPLRVYEATGPFPTDHFAIRVLTRAIDKRYRDSIHPSRSFARNEFTYIVSTLAHKRLNKPFGGSFLAIGPPFISRNSTNGSIAPFACLNACNPMCYHVFAARYNFFLLRACTMRFEVGEMNSWEYIFRAIVVIGASRCQKMYKLLLLSCWNDLIRNIRCRKDKKLIYETESKQRSRTNHIFPYINSTNIYKMEYRVMERIRY